MSSKSAAVSGDHGGKSSKTGRRRHGLHAVLLFLVAVSLLASYHRTIVPHMLTLDHLESPDPAKLPVAMDDPNSFSGCLIIMDDNHYLIEWLAYHYHVMPLRRLIVFPEPNARTTPVPILDRWNNRINITIWNEIDVFGTPQRAKLFFRPGVLLQHRQDIFLSKCLRALKAEGRGWTMITDTDEYISVNPRVYSDPLDPLYNLGKPLNATGSNESTTAASIAPPQDSPGSVLRFLQLQGKSFRHTFGGINTLLEGPCTPLTRKEFGTREFVDPSSPAAKEPTRASFYAEYVLQMNASHFQTFRWRLWGQDHKKWHSEIVGKALVNLNLTTKIGDKAHVHSPLEECTEYGMWLSDAQNPLVANHYSGTLEQSLFRVNDVRVANNGTSGAAYRIQRFHEDQQFDFRVEPENIQDWLPGFVESVGREEAQRLLEYAGQPYAAASYVTNVTL